MSTLQRKMRLEDLGDLSRANRAQRHNCLESLHKLPLNATAADIERVVLAEFPPLMDEIVVLGAKAIVASLQRPRSRLSAADLERGRVQRLETEQRMRHSAKTIVERVEVGAAVVEYLDSMMVAGKCLGDCYLTDLQREHHRLIQNGQAILAQASLLRRIADCLEPTSTVRMASKRPAILEILREHFAE